MPANILKRVLPERLIHLRSLRHWTQLHLALQSDISQSGLNRLESGLSSDMKLSTLQKLARCLDVNPAYLFAFCENGACSIPLCPNLAIARYGAKPEARRCAVCDLAIPSQKSHLLADCIAGLYGAGRSSEYLSTLFGLPVSAIAAIIREIPAVSGLIVLSAAPTAP